MWMRFANLDWSRSLNGFQLKDSLRIVDKTFFLKPSELEVMAAPFARFPEGNKPRGNITGLR